MKRTLFTTLLVAGLVLTAALAGQARGEKEPRAEAVGNTVIKTAAGERALLTSLGLRMCDDAAV